MFTKICPKCGSTSIHPYVLMMGFNMDSSLREYCMSCSYGYNDQIIFPEIPEVEVEEFRKGMSEITIEFW
ncbi:hypothetical protein GOV11_01535 [Candidatus Woesearchaeota archaeon]|nr:hypothetical protein [Candidatus Woesearchaeota archaeon]